MLWEKDFPVHIVLLARDPNVNAGKFHSRITPDVRSDCQAICDSTSCRTVEPVVDHSIVKVELATAPDKQNL
ncbi:MAG: hypothetical protein GQ469_06675 [Methanosarcinales archaeon]|nr:hypothetical protein [Methanosarcinales archaeon]